MATPYETLSPDHRKWERDRQRRLIADAPRTAAGAAFHATAASRFLALQTHIQDALLTHAEMTPVDGDCDRGTSVRNELRLALNMCAEMFGRSMLAIQYDKDVVTEALFCKEPIPGLNPLIMRNVRAAQALKEENSKKSRVSVAQRIRRSQYSAASSAALPAFPAPVLALPALVPAAASRAPDPRCAYPCHACGLKGHWKTDGKCKPEDVRAHLARLAALISPAAGETADDGTGSGP